MVPQTFALQEGLLIADDVFVADGGQDAYLVECILGFLVGKVAEFDFLEGVGVPISEPFDFVDGGIGALALMGGWVPSFARMLKSLIDMITIIT